MGRPRCGWHPAGASSRLRVTPPADARLQIINDPTAPAGDRLRAVEQLESRALGKPKETAATEVAEPEELAAMRAMSPEARRILLRQMSEAERKAAQES